MDQSKGSCGKGAWRGGVAAWRSGGSKNEETRVYCERNTAVDRRLEEEDRINRCRRGQKSCKSTNREPRADRKACVLRTEGVVPNSSFQARYGTGWSCCRKHARKHTLGLVETRSKRQIDPEIPGISPTATATANAVIKELKCLGFASRVMDMGGLFMFTLQLGGI